MKICAYVVSKQAKQTYAHESYNVRAWPGFEMVLDVLRRSEYVVEYAGKATVCQYDVCLVSITSDCDWWPFIAERASWPSSKTRVIAGGPGVLNIRPFLEYADVFVLGRSEDIILPLIEAEQSKQRLQSRSVIYSDSFDADATYEIAQAVGCYPHSFLMANGKRYQERSIGCPNHCFFCGYTWHRGYIGDGHFTAGADSMSIGNREHTIADLLNMPPDRWQDSGPLRIVGLDGMSERLRFKANKRITRDMWREFLAGLKIIKPPHQVKVYCIVGYPGETEADWEELVGDLASMDSAPKTGKQWSILLHCTPFRAMPATPCATWPMSLMDYRQHSISKHLKQPSMSGNVFYQGNAFWAVESMGTDSLPTVVHSALCLRGTEQDAPNMRALAQTPKYWRANTAQKLKTLEHHFDVERLFKAYTADDLPTRYLPVINYSTEGKAA